MPNFSGDWNLTKHDDLTPVLDALQIPADKRPPGQITSLTVNIAQNGNDFVITTTSPRGTRETKFSVGGTFETELMAGTIKIKFSAAWEGDSLVMTGERGAKLIRRLVDGKLVTTFDVGGTLANVYFNKA